MRFFNSANFFVELSVFQEKRERWQESSPQRWKNWVMMRCGLKFNIPTLGYSPGEEIYAHVPDERISLDFISRSISGNAAIAYELMKD